MFFQQPGIGTLYPVHSPVLFSYVRRLRAQGAGSPHSLAEPAEARTRQPETMGAVSGPSASSACSPFFPASATFSYFYDEFLKFLFGHRTWFRLCGKEDGLEKTAKNSPSGCILIVKNAAFYPAVRKFEANPLCPPVRTVGDVVTASRS